MKKAILVVSFGTSYPEPLRKTIGAVEDDMRRAFIKYKVCRAFTSGVIIKKLKERDGIETDTVASALERLISDGFDEVICVVTHIISGFEYDKVTEAVKVFSDKIKIHITRPLLSLTADYGDLIDAIKDEFPKESLCVLMGHGTEHFSNAVYPALKYHLDIRGFKNVYIGTVEGFPSLYDVIGEIKDSPIKKAVLMPLMLVAGDHANNDMASEWKTALENIGFETECVMKGLGEYESIRKLYVERARECI